MAATMEILERFTRPLQVNEADRPPVDLAANCHDPGMFPETPGCHTMSYDNQTSHYR